MREAFNFNKFWGDPELATHVVFRRKSLMYCVYCGRKCYTAEHCPSKTFLKRPLPSNLPTVPACKACNNGFSSDERYTSWVINFLIEYYQTNNKEIYKITAEDRYQEIKDAKEAVGKFILEPFFDDRMARVFRKLALCHAVYEMSEGYYGENWKEEPDRLVYTLKPYLSPQQWDDLEYAEVVNNESIPRIGSRIFRNTYVIQGKMKFSQTEENFDLSAVVVDWVDIQDGYYKYQVYFKEDRIWVKMIFQNFLYCEVVFSQNNENKI